jgi:hypothetical protein
LAWPLAAAGQAPPARETRIGNYCLECHTATDKGPIHPLAGVEPIEWAKTVPCDTFRKAREEVHFTDSLVAAILNSSAELRRQGFSTAAQDKRLFARRASYSHLGEAGIISLSAASGQARALRFQMNKVYARLELTRDERQRRLILGVVALASLFLLSAVALGYRHTGKAQRGTQKGRIAPMVWAAVASALGFMLFAVPVFGWARSPAPTTPEDTQRQAAMDLATRVGDAAQRLSAQAWVLASIGADWAAVDRPSAEQALAASMQAGRAKEANAKAYWGQSQAIVESSVTWRPAHQDIAAGLSDRIETASAQAWPLWAVAGELAAVDQARAQEALAAALAVASQNPSGYLRDLDLRAISVTWAQIDVDKGVQTCLLVKEPLLRAWGLRQIASGQPDTHKAAAILASALEAARAVSAPVDRTWALREVGRAMAVRGDQALAARVFGQALEAATAIDDPQVRAYAVGEVAAAWATVDPTKGLEVAGKVDGAYPEARTVAFHRVGVVVMATDAARAKGILGQALQEAQRAHNPHSSARFSAAVIADWARLEPERALEAAEGLSDDFFRAQAQRDVAIAWSATDKARAYEVASKITSPFLKTQALTALGAAWVPADKAKASALFQEAFALADKLEDAYPLRDLAIAWAQVDPRRALEVVDKMDNNDHKARALQAIALAWARTDQVQGAMAFDRAMKEAKAVRQVGEPFAAALALRDLAAAWAQVDPVQAGQAYALAFQAAKRVGVKY